MTDGRVLRVLIADPDQNSVETLGPRLRSEGMIVDSVGSGGETEARLDFAVPDLLILESALPDVSGIAICRAIRERASTRNLPLIMISARAEERDKVLGLTAGADDYVIKPFSVPELVARIHAVLRRTQSSTSTQVQAIGDIVLDRAARRVRRGGRIVHLGPVEFSLLACLMQRPGQVFTREQIMDAAWPEGAEVGTRTVDVQLGRLRKALSKGAETDPILTVRGVGYVFDDRFGSG